MVLTLICCNFLITSRFFIFYYIIKALIKVIGPNIWVNIEKFSNSNRVYFIFQALTIYGSLTKNYNSGPTQQISQIEAESASSAVHLPPASAKNTLESEKTFASSTSISWTLRVTVLHCCMLNNFISSVLSHLFLKYIVAKVYSCLCVSLLCIWYMVASVKNWQWSQKEAGLVGL